MLMVLLFCNLSSFLDDIHVTCFWLDLNFVVVVILVTCIKVQN